MNWTGIAGIPCLAAALAAALLAGGGAARGEGADAQGWEETVSAEDFVRHHPDRAQALLKARYIIAQGNALGKTGPAHS